MIWYVSFRNPYMGFAKHRDNGSSK